MPDASTLALILLPVVTGLASVLWSQIAAVSRGDLMLLNATSSLLLYLLLRWFGSEPSDLVGLVRAAGWVRVSSYLVLSVAISAMWFVALSGSHVIVCGLAEIAYPIFVVVFSYVLVGPVRLSPACMVGGVLVLAGSALVSWGSAGHADPPACDQAAVIGVDRGP